MNPTTMRETIVEEIAIRASAERIFEAIVDPEERLKWWGAKDISESTEMNSVPSTSICVVQSSSRGH